MKRNIIKNVKASISFGIDQKLDVVPIIDFLKEHINNNVQFHNNWNGTARLRVVVEEEESDEEYFKRIDILRKMSLDNIKRLTKNIEGHKLKLEELENELQK